MTDSKISALASGSPAQAGDEYVVARSGANYKLTLTNIAASMPPIGATTPNSGAFTTLSASGGLTLSGGNLAFTGTAQRITGDMNNGTVANRFGIQNSVVNTSTNFLVLPNGTATGANANFCNNSDPTNAAIFAVGIAGGTESRLNSFIVGTGTYLPMTFYTGGSERVRIDTSGNVRIGTTNAPSNKDTVTPKFIVNGSGVAGSMQVVRNTTPGAGGGILELTATRGTDVNSYTVLQSGDGVGSVVFGGADGNEFVVAASVVAQVDGTPGDNDMPGRLIFNTTADGASSTTERMRIDSSGNVGIGGTAGAANKVEVAGTLPTSSAVSRAISVAGTVPSGSTSVGISFNSALSTQAASFTVTNFGHFVATQGTIGSGSSVTAQYGFLADGNLTGATNNYGFFSNIAAASNRWNFYAAGTARNYFAGDTGIGTTGSTTIRLNVKGSDATSSNYGILIENSTPANLFYVRNDGLIFTGLAANSPYNLTTGSAANAFIASDGVLYRSTSSLRYKTDVADAEHGLADVLKLRSVTYKAKNDGDTVFGGLIAEEVHDAGLTEFVAYDKEGRPDAIHYGNMVALLTKAIQEQQAMIDELKTKVAALETK